jgi:transposase
MPTGDLFDEQAMKAPTRADAVETADAPRLRVANRRQVILRPMDLEALLAPDHEVRALWALIERFDLSAFYESIRARGTAPGRAATDPKILLCLWMFATSQGLGSARRLAELCDEHDAYRWICGGVTVNHTMLAEFRVGHGEALDGLLTEMLAVLLQNGLVTLRRISHDGMRVRASAGADSFRREKSLKRCLREARQQVKHVNQLADEDPSRTFERAAQQRAAKERQARIERAVAQLPRIREQKRTIEERENARVSTTDPDARVMKMADGGFRPAYNVQLATDVDSRVIVGVTVTNSGTDHRQMIPMLDQIEERLAEPDEVLVDGGFVNLEAIDAATQREVTVYAPIPASRKDGVDPYKRKPTDSDATAAWRSRMNTDDGKEIYKDRAATAETVNADLRGHRGLDKFGVRGLSKVVTIATLTALTYNSLRMISMGLTT